MKFFYVVISLILMVSCNNQTIDSPCMQYELSIQELEEKIYEMHQNEGNLKAELESAQLYIKTLEYENQELTKRHNYN